MLHLANIYTLYDPDMKKNRGFKGKVRVTWYNAACWMHIITTYKLYKLTKLIELHAWFEAWAKMEGARVRSLAVYLGSLCCRTWQARTLGIMNLKFQVSIALNFKV